MNSLSRYKKTFLRIPAPEAILCVTVLAVMLLAAEIVVRIYDRQRGQGFFSDYRNEIAKAYKPVVPYRIFGFVPYQTVNGKRFISSRRGELYPIEKPAGTTRIVCFGGSTTEAYFEGVHYPLALQSLLRKRLGRDTIEVINVANSAYATTHSIILLEFDVIYWKPDIVILSENLNDLTASYWPGLRFDYSNKYGGEFYASPISKDTISCLSVALQHSRLYWVIYNRLKGIGARGRIGKARFRHYPDTPDPLAVQIFRQNLRTFIQIARSHGSTVILATQAMVAKEEYFRPLFFEPINKEVVYPYLDEFAKHHRYFNEVIREVAQEENVYLVDNERLLEGHQDYFIDYVHNNAQGLRKLGEYFADFIITHKLVQ
jgi:lysophospholipase L1-like esterase